jgi:hypothetical protein
MIGFLSDVWKDQLDGFIGLDQYDERNLVGQALLDRFAARYGRRPEFFAPSLGYDFGACIAAALADAHPLTGAGVRNGLERIKFIEAASGAPGTRIRFGHYIRQGWMGSEYLVARRMHQGGIGHSMHGTIDGRVSA